MKIATCLALLLCGATLPAHPVAQGVAAASQPPAQRFFRGSPKAVGFTETPLGGPTRFEGATAAEDESSENLDELRDRQSEIHARLERLELESELARMEREQEHRRNVRAQHRELENAIAQLDEQREDMEHAAEIQEEDFQEQWEGLEGVYGSEKERVEQRFESECQEARSRFDLEMLEKRNSIQDDSEAETFDAQAEIEWGKRERNFRQEQASLLEQMEQKYVEARHAARADWRALQGNTRNNMHALDRQKLSLEQRLEDLDEEGDSELEISEMRARAEVLEETRALQTELDRVERAIERAEGSSSDEFDPDCDEQFDPDCDEPCGDSEESDEDEMVEEEIPDDVEGWLASNNDDDSEEVEAENVYVDDERDVSSEIDELTDEVQQLRQDVDELREQVEALWKAVRAREKKEHEVGKAPEKSVGETFYAGSGK
jgi:hypothetical protein